MRHPIWGYSVYLENFHRKIEQNLKITPDAPKNESGLTQMIMMGKSIRQIWVNNLLFVHANRLLGNHSDHQALPFKIKIQDCR